MERLSPVDAAWFRMDPVSPADIIAVMTLDGMPDEARLRDVLNDRLSKHRRFRCRVVESPGRAAPPYWDEEDESQRRAHLLRRRLAAPGGETELLALVNEVANEPFDFRRSPWSACLVDGMIGGSALIVRVHHCVGDGFWLLTVLLSLTDIDAEGTERALPRATPPEHRPGRHSPWKALAASRRVSRRLRDLVHLIALPFDPPTRLRGHPRGERRLAWSTAIELSRVRTLAGERGATINDVLLSALAGALRRYVVEHGDAPVGFRAVVPVNLRPSAGPIDPTRGNWFGLVFADLPIAEPDREARLLEVVRTMARIKVSEEAAVSLAVLGVLGRLPAALEHAADDVLARKGTLVVTNVPGPRRAIYLAGRRIRDMTFWAPHSCGLSCGVSILSYAGAVRIGVRSDAAVVQDPELLARLFEEEFAAWEEESDRRKNAPPTCE